MSLRDRLTPSRRTLIKGGLITGGVAVLGVGGCVYGSGLSYSEGWRMGNLTKFSSRGTWKRAFTGTGEGTLMMGNESSTATWAGADGQTVHNPWHFSGTNEQVERFRALQGRMVAIRYRQIMKRWSAFQGDTDYFVEDIHPVATDFAGGVCAVPNAGGIRSEGDRSGRFVKVTAKGTVTKTYECTFQEGTSGNRFVEMSILDRGIYECAINYLRAGRMCVVSYRTTLVRNPLARDTNYDIFAIRPVEGLR
jgi:hypothetical protein